MVTMKKILIILALVFIIIQFFRIDKTNPSVDKNMDFVTIKNAPEDVAQSIRNSCYDCHSNESVYPWYANIQPIAWFLKNHINEGRKELNFSTFATYDAVRQARKLNKAAREVEEGEMPLESYLLIHQNAKLSEEQKEKMINFFKTVKEDIMMTNNISEEQLKPQKRTED